ncbi:PQQ-dependent sugar dehydrogenase [Pedobacter metabolipauper]|uniref:Glucose/arabinose dehydrogenase n=1 Tax=Pedobacter metabolipauper TaxID=425513 RepID=A0A4R6SW87_9SPHI|nr:PQQ-dependent sugar dehydrogenase [Pedobacter metabolipauper]TDQ08689.1 glucose/arabinose dehydrogenase [Pedobacter metabolipauper]
MKLALIQTMRTMFVIGSCLVLLFSCSKKKTGDVAEPVSTTPTTQPVERNAANTNYTPAFTGQTRISGVTTATRIRSSILTSSLTAPWGIAALPDGRFLVTEKAGRMRIVSGTGTVSNAINGIPAVNSAGQGGLLGLCLDPDFTLNRMVYWSFSEPGTGGNMTSVAKGRLADNEQSIEGATVIFRSGPAYSGVNHYGGRVLFDPAGNLFVSTGERADNVTRAQAQSTDASIGKVIRITREGQAVAGNPFIGQAGALPELYSIGHRNPQGLAVHPVTGEIWQCEHGPRGGDELNRIQAGGNYGWPVITYGLEYSGQPVLTGIQQRAGMTQPVYYWDPVVSPSGMTFYNSERISEWRNNLFIGALSGMHIVRLVIENNQVTGEERLLADQNQRFRDITQGTDGALYAITDQGRLYKIDRE